MNDLEENLHCGIEGMAVPYIDQIRNGDISFYDAEESRIEFNYYLVTQYFRTTRIKERMKTAFSDIPKQYAHFDLNIERIWNVVSHIMATNLGHSLSREDSHMKLIVLENNTKIPFITSDQPIVNIRADYTSFDAPTELELYYPQTPDIALILSEEKNSLYSGNLDEHEVIRLNSKMVTTSQEQVYASEKSVLERYL